LKCTIFYDVKPKTELPRLKAPGSISLGPTAHYYSRKHHATGSAVQGAESHRIRNNLHFSHCTL